MDSVAFISCSVAELCLCGPLSLVSPLANEDYFLPQICSKKKKNEHAD